MIWNKWLWDTLTRDQKLIKENVSQIKHNINLFKENILSLGKVILLGNNLIFKFYVLILMLISDFRFNKVIFSFKNTSFYWPWKKLGKGKFNLKTFLYYF